MIKPGDKIKPHVGALIHTQHPTRGPCFICKRPRESVVKKCTEEYVYWEGSAKYDCYTRIEKVQVVKSAVIYRGEV